LLRTSFAFQAIFKNRIRDEKKKQEDEEDRKRLMESQELQLSLDPIEGVTACHFLFIKQNNPLKVTLIAKNG
jgi:hypothetical protein